MIENKTCSDEHNPDIWVNNLSEVHKASKCLRCGQAIISIAGSRWMTNREFREFEQRNHGVNDEI